MSTKKVMNCYVCGRFCSTKTSYPFCKKCYDSLCNNCWEPHLIPPDLLEEVPHFCDLGCQGEFLAKEELIMSVSELAKRLDNLRKMNYYQYEKSSYKYENRDFTYTNNGDSKETTFSLKIKHDSQPNQELYLTHTS